MKFLVLVLSLLIPLNSDASIPQKQGAFIPAGKYTIGDFSFRKYNRVTAEGDQCEGGGDTADINLNSFLMDRYEVTNSEYGNFLKATKRQAPKYWNDQRLNADQQPVVGVNLKDAEAYCKWAGKRLPNEFEWEAAARGGKPEIRFPWGNDDPTNGVQKYANLFDDAKMSDGYRFSAPVGSFETGKNALGIYDMTGNVGSGQAAGMIAGSIAKFLTAKLKILSTSHKKFQLIGLFAVALGQALHGELECRFV